MAVTNISPLVNDLESDNKRKVSQSTDQLKAMGPVVVPALFEALASRKRPGGGASTRWRASSINRGCCR